MFFHPPGPSPSIFLRPFAPRELPRFITTTDALTPVEPCSSWGAPVCSLPLAPTWTAGRACCCVAKPQCHLFPGATSGTRQVSLLTAFDLQTIPPSTTILPFPCLGFVTLHQPDKLPRLSPGQTSTGRRERRRAVWGSPLARRLPDRLGRIRFVILRTGRSPPVAPHPSSRRRSYFRLQVRNGNLVGTCTPPIKRLRRRTSPRRKPWETITSICGKPR